MAYREKSDIIRGIVEDLGYKFYFENWDNVLKDLLTSGLNKNKTTAKYPFIVMDSDIDEDRGSSEVYEADFDATFYIVAESKANYTTEQRIENVFKTTIYPMYDNLLFGLGDSVLIEWSDTPLEYENHKVKNIYNAQIKSEKTNAASSTIDAMKININIKIRRYGYV